MKNPYQKKVFIALLSFLFLALAVVFIFYDALYPQGPFYKTLDRSLPSAHPTEQSNDELILELDEELKNLETQYNFNTDPAEDALAAPQFEDELDAFAE